MKLALSSTALSLLLAATVSQAGTVVINEIAWMGTSSSSFDEWIELYNSGNRDIDLAGWTLLSQDGSPSIRLKGTLAAGGHFLLERTDDSSVASVTADQIYTGALSDSGETLELRDASGTLVDAVTGWHAGSTSLDASMERIDPNSIGDESNWADAIDPYEGGFGSPRGRNGNSGTSADCDYPPTLEITSINIGQGDATLIATPSRLLLADAGESYWNSHNDADKIAETVRSRYGAACSHLDYVIISHFHLDHIGYLKAAEDINGNLLNENGGAYQNGDNIKDPQFLAGYAYLVKHHGFTVGATLVRDFITHNPNLDPTNGGSKTFRNWRAYLLSPKGKLDFKPVMAELGSHQVSLGKINGKQVTIDVVLVDGATPSSPDGCDPATYFLGSDDQLRGDRTGDALPPSENDLSLAFIVSFGSFQMFIGGDTSGENYQSQWGYQYHDTETCLAEDPVVQTRYGGHLEVLRVSHHGSSHSTNQAFVHAFSPTISIFSVGDNNSYGHVNRDVLNRVIDKSISLNSGQVFMTEAGADVSEPADACHALTRTACAQVADGEFPTTTETNEAGDAGVLITVGKDASGFTVQGDTSKPAQMYLSR